MMNTMWMDRAARAAVLVLGLGIAAGCDGREPAPHEPPAERTEVEAPTPVYDPAIEAATDTGTVTPPSPAAEPVAAPASPAPQPSEPSAPSQGVTGATSTAPAPSPTASSTDEILRATSRRYEQVRSLQAEFSQELRNPLLGTTTRSSGTLYQRQPDRFLMRFSDPDGDVIVSDGRHFWLYYPSVDARQVIRAPATGGAQGLDLRAQFIGDPVARFRATDEGREVVAGRDSHVLTLVPREPLGYRSLKVWIDREDHLVRRFELTEENGAVRLFELRNVVMNPSLPDALFEFTPPPGAQVIQRG